MAVTPFAFSENLSSNAAWTAYVMGVLIVLSGIFAASRSEADQSEWLPIVLGVILFVSPWVLAFTATTSLAWSAWIIGVLVVLSAGSLVLTGRATPTHRPTPA